MVAVKPTRSSLGKCCIAMIIPLPGPYSDFILAQLQGRPQVLELRMERSSSQLA